MKSIFTAICVITTMAFTACDGRITQLKEVPYDTIVAPQDTAVIEEPVVTRAMNAADRMVEDLNALLENNDSVKIVSRMDDAKAYIKYLKTLRSTDALEAYRDKIREFAGSYKSKLGKLTYDHQPLAEIIEESIE